MDWPYLSSALLLALSPSSWALYTVIGRRVATGADPFDTTYAILVLGSLPILALGRPAGRGACPRRELRGAGRSRVILAPPPGRPS